MNAELEKELLDFAFIENVKSGADKISEKIGFSYFSHQLEIAIAIIRDNVAILNLPTGIGKSFICAIIAKYYADKKENILFIHYNLTMQHQYESDFDKYGVACENVKHTIGFRTNKLTENKFNKVIIVN